MAAGSCAGSAGCSPLLWPLHRAHHTAHYMSIRVTYRNNFFYYLMMPGLWISGVLIYLGFGTVYLVYIVVKLTVILGAHSAVRWDEPLYRRSFRERDDGDEPAQPAFSEACS